MKSPDLLLVILAVLTIANTLVGLAIRHGLKGVELLLSEIDRPVASGRVPDFSVTTLRQRQLSLEHLSGEPFALVFLSSTCSLCSRLLSDADELGPLSNNIVLLWRGDRDRLSSVRTVDVAVVPETLIETLGIRMFPTVVIADARGRIVARLNPHTWGEVVAPLNEQRGPRSQATSTHQIPTKQVGVA